MRPLDPPAEPEISPIEQLRPGSGGGRTRERDPETGITTSVFDWDIGGAWRFENGITWEDSSVTTMRIADDDPLSAEVEVRNTCLYDDGSLVVDIVEESRMTCTADAFVVTCRLEVTENSAPLLDRTWDYRFPRPYA